MPQRYSIPKLLFTLLAATGMVSLPSCISDRSAMQPSESPLRFEVEQKWSSVTKAASQEGKETSPVGNGLTALKSESGEEVLFLHSETLLSPATKASTIDSAEEFYDEFGAFAFVYPTSDTWSDAGSGLSPNYMYNIRVEKSEGWKTAYFWPGSGYKIKFFAYAPYNGAGLSLSSSGALGAPAITYEVPQSVSAQKEILTSSPEEVVGNTNAAKTLTFSHALTAVRFTSDAMLPGVISEISLNGVYFKGTLEIGSSSWTPDASSTRDFSQTLSVAVDGSSGQAVTSEAQTFVMLPQTLPPGANISVSYKDNLTGTERSLKADISGTTWPFGAVIVYKISTSGISVTPTLEVTAPETFDYQGGTHSYTVKSYASVTQTGSSSTTTLPTAWTAQFSTDGGASWSSDKPLWLTDFTVSGDGGSEASSYNAAVSAQTKTDHESILKAETPVSDYDLSTEGGTKPMNTANCYIVNASGSYKLPLVYGNGVKNGSVNESSYKTSVSGSVLQNFVNHLGAAITSPYIPQNASCTPASAKLVWQDSEGLVSNVQLNAERDYLTFEVNNSKLVPGNALVAVCDGNGDIMWSWHLWFTDYKLGEELKTAGGYSFLPYNIGWVDDATKYEERSVLVRFTQSGTGLQQTIEIKQNEHYEQAYYFRNTFFQWGRKDPMMSNFVSATYNDFFRQWITSNVARTWYDENGTAYVDMWNYADFGSGTSEIASCIKNPHYFDKNDDDMFNNYNNMWDSDNSANPANSATTNTNANTMKTIYDPSPVGYKVPSGAVLAALSGASRTWDGTRKGYLLSCDGDKTSFFPAIGLAYIEGEKYTIKFGVTESSTYGYYWSALPASTANNNIRAWNLIFNQYDMFQVNMRVRVGAESVRPVAE